MRILIFSDLQATYGHEQCFSDPTVPLQIWRVTRFFKELERIYSEWRCDALWDLGDLTDDRTAIPLPVIDTLCDMLEPFTGEWNIKLVGNHEQWLRSTRIHSGKMFRRFFNVVDTAQTFQMGKVNIICLSYNDDVEATLKYIRRQPKLEPTVMIGHFQMAGSQTNSGVLATGVPRAEIDFPLVTLLGHIHRPQTVGNIHYVGSPFQQNWGEAGEEKRVGILDIECESVSLKWVPLTGFPRYRQVGLAEFMQKVTENSEDRYKVVLRSLAETEKFYAHPLMNRADEAVYDYESVKSEPEGTDISIPRTKQDIYARYLKLKPPGESGIDLDEQTMRDFGDMITSPE